LQNAFHLSVHKNTGLLHFDLEYFGVCKIDSNAEVTARPVLVSKGRYADTWKTHQSPETNIYNYRYIFLKIRNQLSQAPTNQTRLQRCTVSRETFANMPT
jgi:hypothetical protein